MLRRMNDERTIPGEEFRVIFWNIWSESQLTEPRLTVLCRRFDELIDGYAPDVFGLNEVAMNHATGRSRVLDYFRDRGYEVHFSPHGPDRSNLLMGSALVSRQKPVRVTEPVLGPDATATSRGFPGYNITAIDADLPIASGSSVRVVVNYWAHLMPYNWRSHNVHTQALQQHLAEAAAHPRTIIGGDFNELKRMRAISRLSGIYHRATGSFLEPTWRWRGRRRFLVQANYDNVLWSRGPELRLREFKVLSRMPSDHAPLMAHFLASEG